MVKKVFLQILSGQEGFSDLGAEEKMWSSHNKGNDILAQYHPKHVGIIENCGEQYRKVDWFQPFSESKPFFFNN